MNVQSYVTFHQAVPCNSQAKSSLQLLGCTVMYSASAHVLVKNILCKQICPGSPYASLVDPLLKCAWQVHGCVPCPCSSLFVSFYPILLLIFFLWLFLCFFCSVRNNGMTKYQLSIINTHLRTT